MPQLHATLSLLDPVALDPGASVLLGLVPREVDKVSADFGDDGSPGGVWHVEGRLGLDGVDPVQREAGAVGVGRQDAEQVLLALRQTLDCKVGLLAETGDDYPVL